MAALPERLFLLVLLALDWAADPALLAPAVQPLAQAWGSTENVCPSVAYRRDVLRHCRPDPRPAGAAPPAAAPAPPPGLPRAAPCPAPARVRPAYLCMCLRR